MQTKGIRGICTVIGRAFGKSIVKLMYCNVAASNQSAMNCWIGVERCADWTSGNDYLQRRGFNFVRVPKICQKSLAPATTFPHRIVAHNARRFKGSEVRNIFSQSKPP